MLLTNPYTGHVVDASESAAKRLIQQGFKPVEKPAPKRRAPKKPKTTE